MYTCIPATVIKVKYSVFESTDIISFFIGVCNNYYSLYIEEHKNLGNYSTFLSFRTLVLDKYIRLTMDPRCSGQDVLRCQTPMPPLYCEVCIIHLCKACVGDHIMDESKEHKVVPFKNRGSTYKCPKHCTKKCVLYCERCDIPICLLCICCGEHENHKKVDIFESLQKKKTFLQEDLKELEKTIYPQYQEIASYISIQKSSTKENSQKLKEAIEKQGEEWRKEIDTIIKTLKSDLDKMNSAHLVALKNKETEITFTISKITKGIEDLKIFLESNDLSLISAYKYINDEFRKLPQKHQLPLPSFTPKKISSEQIYQQFGYLSN